MCSAPELRPEMLTEVEILNRPAKFCMLIIQKETRVTDGLGYV